MATIVSLVLHEAATPDRVPIEVGIYLSITASSCLAAGFAVSTLSDPGVAAARKVRV